MPVTASRRSAPAWRMDALGQPTGATADGWLDDHGCRREATFRRPDYCFGPTVPTVLSRADLTQPLTSPPVLGLRYITDDQPSCVCA